MKNLKLNIVIGWIIVGIAIIGGYFFPKYKVGSGAVAGTNSGAGVTNSSAKLYTTTFSPSSPSATSTTLTNTDATDRIIISGIVTCVNATTSYTAYTGSGLAKWLIQIATTSGSITGALADVNSNYAMNITVPTSTNVSGANANPGVASPQLGNTYSASSTEGILPYTSRIWPTGVGLTVSSNATNTASCTVGVNTISS